MKVESSKCVCDKGLYFYFLIKQNVMETTWGSITTEWAWYSVENMLFTYSEEEMEENRINKLNASLILNPQFIPVYPQMIRDWYSYLESIIFWFINFFLSTNERFYCSNEQLWEMLWVSDKTISLAVKKLKDTGLIDISYKIKSNWGKIRFIRRGNLKNVNSDFTKMYSPTLQKCKGIENKIIENNIIDFSDLYKNYYWKNKWINETICNKLIDTKLKQWITLEEIRTWMVLYNCECRLKQDFKFVKKFETWIKEFQPLDEQQINEELYAIIKSYRDKKKSDEKFWQSTYAKTLWNDLKQQFGEEKVKWMLKQANSIQLNFT